MTLKKIEITTVRFVFEDDEPNEEAKSGNISQPNENISKKRENISEKPKSLRKTRTLFTDEQKADIIRRYKAGEGPKAIAESLNCARSTIGLIIKNAGAVEGRRGAHLNKPKPEPQPEAEENEPV